MLRELNREEIGYVSGGVDTEPPPIVVIGARLQTATLSDQMFSFGGTSTFGDLLYTWGQRILDAGANFIGSDIQTDEEQMKESEKAISEKFNHTTAEETRRDADGKIISAKGADGWKYVDTDGNGIFDQRQRLNGDGSLTVDFGTTTIVL